ncbi:hypothetical protein [Aliikangiella coralliicola]|uniref:4Fe-4S ferredoxin-type domain-containing protein n=1 Tax=Aliikangiella coralliicola TaxID=2592383 RepID=A0A545UJI7_9GAMM|nr:hypothetical protein [Aliikangiella coralliicola]TQV89628.1 hypothetical protein FLL46_01730 [Aliikangiella coralliicola]
MSQLKFDGKELSEQGLNLHAIFKIADLPDVVKTQLLECSENLKAYNQLIVIAHGGRLMWQKVKEWQTRLQPHGEKNSPLKSKDPIDDFSTEMVTQFFAQRFAENEFELIFPNNPAQNNKPIGLQKLGELAGWHHPSPFRVGINQEWGSWFAYRAVVLVKSQYQLITHTYLSPCHNCHDKPCISACPAEALRDGDLSLEKCLDYRKKQNSLCENRCLARLACPIAKSNQYSEEQVNYHYRLSLDTITS